MENRTQKINYLKSLLNNSEDAKEQLTIFFVSQDESDVDVIRGGQKITISKKEYEEHSKHYQGEVAHINFSDAS